MYQPLKASQQKASVLSCSCSQHDAPNATVVRVGALPKCLQLTLLSYIMASLASLWLS